MQRVRVHDDIELSVTEWKVLTNALEIGLGMVRVGLMRCAQHHLTTFDTDDVGLSTAQPPNERARSTANIDHALAGDVDELSQYFFV
jgi:hypothetical protein